MGREKTTETVGGTLRVLSGTYRRRIKVLAKSRGVSGSLNDAKRKALADCIFAVENDLEHRSPKSPDVEAMRHVRNVLLDDCGENEPHPWMRYPQIEAMAARIAGAKKQCARRPVPTLEVE